MRYIDVILPLAIRDCYTYSLPDDLAMPEPGTRVVVPVMKKEVRGVVLREHNEPIDTGWQTKIRPVLSVINDAPIVSLQQLALWQWMSSYYMCTLGEVMSAALPNGLDKRLLNPPKRKRVHLEAYQGSIEPQHPLTTAQQKCIDEIEELWLSGKSIVLLHGVTSSGKTEVYIQLIEKQLQAGQNVLYLVPEIALTTQLTSRLQRIFGHKLIVYHSRFTDAEREELYHAAAKKEPHVVIGARSAIFLPIPQLGLVIVDEEHETSYKQTEPAPRYHARMAALMLAKIHNSHVVLGSATPSVESYYMAEKGVYGLTRLTERYAGIQLPEVKLIDLRQQYKRKEMYEHLSDPLVHAIQQTLAEGKQVILFQNRRGYAPMLQCSQCGQVPRCVQCDVPLTLHMQAHELRCHYCGYRTTVPTACPHCGSELRVQGVGTERIEDEVQQLFPEARILRMDLDTTRSKTAYQDIINNFAKHECDILIGTQMVTKGLHFDDVQLVGVVNADPLLNQPDFRAYERAYQMLEQVAGRSGRSGEQGQVILQTFDAANQLYSLVQTHDYEQLYRSQLDERRLFCYPPFHRLVCVQLRHHDTLRVETAARVLQQRLTLIFGNRVSAVVMPSVARLQAYYIRHIILRIEQGASLNGAKQRLRETVDYTYAHKDAKGVQIIIDVDPI